MSEGTHSTQRERERKRGKKRERGTPFVWDNLVKLPLQHTHTLNTHSAATSPREQGSSCTQFFLLCFFIIHSSHLRVFSSYFSSSRFVVFFLFLSFFLSCDASTFSSHLSLTKKIRITHFLSRRCFFFSFFVLFSLVSLQLFFPPFFRRWTVS